MTQDETLAELLAQLDSECAAGTAPDWHKISLEHPDLIDELRSLWATAQFASLIRLPDSTPSASVKAEPEIPSIHFEDYELLEELGRGGMGVVYKARQKSLNRLVAIKVLRDGRMASDADKGRFRSEATSAGKLKHPNIVTVYEVGDNEGQPFFAMEYVEGLTLAKRLSHGPLPPRQAAALTVQIALGVQHAHDMGILHRDLKPSNILLSPERVASPSSNSRFSLKVLDGAVPHPKVSDFGLAKRLYLNPESLRDWRTSTGAIVGTPGYMSPEQAMNRGDLNPASDVYSIGAILYEMLTGRPPFQASNPVDALLMVIEQDPVPPRLLVPGIDRDLENICLKCLQKLPNRRYQHASELVLDLRAYLSGEHVSNPTSGLKHFLSRMLRETHHISILENWGLIWIWHSLQIFLLCFLTQALVWYGLKEHGTYLILWTVGLLTWGTILWKWRGKSGPVVFVERQIAHAWAAGVCASISMFVIEVVADLPVLTLSPAIAVATGMVFVFKAGILTGRFYVTAAMMFLTAMVMPLLPQVNILLFGFMSALSFLIPGIKYYRLRKQSEAIL
ncbi:serine/threonine protein kinase [Telmatocola sphagniphila]|uniref:Serine/threonine protein kinase n=2 Tax=Telmatocola sphagniphila TaxID=1123043 RepID=A0A8E6B9V3_9BACT|nr:serine/threonine protein kinase [Telmatocola sphagniphila]